MFTSDAEIKALNQSFRKKAKATDVLSFSQLEGRALAGSALGDVVISLDTAKRQASRYKHTLNAEVLRLLIHGILHLLGYEHVGVSSALASKMRRMEEKLCRRYSKEFLSSKPIAQK